jgi:hypothetical protein
VTRYTIAHWRGDLSLATSFWLNGVVGYFALLALVVGLRAYIPILAGMVVFVIVMVWACVGIARSALHVVRSPRETITRKFKAYMALAVVLVVVLVSAADMGVLLHYSAAGRA